jgi:hypothetical protein
MYRRNNGNLLTRICQSVPGFSSICILFQLFQPKCNADLACHSYSSFFYADARSIIARYKASMSEANGGSFIYLSYIRSTECQAFSPVVRIGSSRPLSRKRVLPRLWFQEGWGSRLQEGAGGANLDKGTVTLVLLV